MEWKQLWLDFGRLPSNSGWTTIPQPPPCDKLTTILSFLYNKFLDTVPCPVVQRSYHFSWMTSCFQCRPGRASEILARRSVLDQCRGCLLCWRPDATERANAEATKN